MFPIFNINNFKNMHRFLPPLTINIPVDDTVKGGSAPEVSTVKPETQPLTINIPVDDTVKGGSAPEVSTVKPETPKHKIQVIYNEDLVNIGIIVIDVKEEDLSIQTPQEDLSIQTEDAEESVSEDPAMLEPTPEAPYGYTATGKIRKRPLKSML